MSAPISNGRETLRQALRGSRSRGGYPQRLSRDAGLSVQSIENFSAGRADLSGEALQAICHQLWNGVRRYNSETDVIELTHKNIATPANHYAPGWSRPGPVRRYPTNCD
jgi:hypothetical protein